MPSEPLFSAQDALAAVSVLRQTLGLPPEQFSAAAFIGMISDEIEQLRAQGHDDTAIAAMVRAATGKDIDSDLLTRHYAAPGQRRPPNAP